MRTGTIYQKTNWLCGTQLTGVLRPKAAVRFSVFLPFYFLFYCIPFRKKQLTELKEKPKQDLRKPKNFEKNKKRKENKSKN